MLRPQSSARRALLGSDDSNRYQTPISLVYSDFFRTKVRVLKVGKSITCHYHTLADAIAQSQPTDRLELEGGVYFEAVSISHALEIVTSESGEDPLFTTRGPCITVATDEPVLLCRVRAVGKGSKPADCVGLLVLKGSPVIRDCKFSAVHVANQSSPLITQCVIKGAEFGSGLRISDEAAGEYFLNEICHHAAECVKVCCGSSPLIHNNRIYQARPHSSLVSIAGGRHGVRCAPVIRDNLISGNGESIADTIIDPGLYDPPQTLFERDLSVIEALIAVTWGASPVVVANVLCNGITGVHFEECSIGEENFQRNRIAGCSSWGVVIGKGSKVHLVDNEISKNAAGMRLRGHQVVIDNCAVFRNHAWGCMIDSSSPTVKNSTFELNANGVAIVHNCTGMLLQQCRIARNTICGLAVMRHGRGKVFNNTICDNVQEGVHITEESKPTLEQNQISGNGTNVLIREQSAPHFIENVLTRPVGHNLIMIGRSSGLYEKNDFNDANAVAHICVFQHSRGHFLKNIIRKGGGSGILADQHSSPLIEGNKFSSLREGVMSSKHSDPIISENEFITCTHALYCTSDGVATFVHNYVRSCGRSFVWCEKGGFATVRDNRLYMSSQLGFEMTGGGCAMIEKNDITQCTEGVGVITGRGSFLTFRGNNTSDCKGFGLLFDDRSNGCVKGNFFNQIGEFAVGSSKMGECEFLNNTIDTTTGYAIYCAAGGFFEDNTIRSCATAGVKLERGSCATFRRNHISLCQGDGIIVTVGSRCVFEEDTVEHNTRSGIVVTGNSAETEMRNLKVVQNGRYGVLGFQGGACNIFQCDISSNKKCGVCFDNAGPIELEECQIRDHPLSLAVKNSGCGKLTGCRITPGPKAESSASDRVVHVWSRGTAALQRCKIDTIPVDGIHVVSGELLVIESSVAGAGEGCGFVIFPEGTLTMTDSSVDDCAIGIKLSEGKEPALHRTSAFASQPNSSNMSKGQRNPKSPMSPNQRQPSAFVLHQEALRAALAEGAHEPQVVSPSSLTNCTIQRHTKIGIHYSGAAAIALDSCTVLWCENGICVEAGSTFQWKALRVENSVKDGVQVLGAAATHCIAEALYVGRSGGHALLCRDASNVNFSGATFTENRLGVFLDASSVTMEKCTVTNHESVGIMLTNASSAAVRSCLVELNAWCGIAVINHASPLIEMTTVRGAEIGILVSRESSPLIKNCSLDASRIGLLVRKTVRDGDFTNEVDRSLFWVVSSQEYDPSKLPFTTAVAKTIVEGTSFQQNTVGIRCHNAITLDVSGCRFTGCKTGGTLGPEENVSIIKSDVEGCTVGFELRRHAKGLIRDCNFTSNKIGISVLDDARTIVARNKFNRNFDHAMLIRSCRRIVIEENTFTGNLSRGVEFTGQSFCRLSNNVFTKEKIAVTVCELSCPLLAQNVLTTCDVGLLATDESAKPIVIGNCFEKNVIGMHATKYCTPQIQSNVFRMNSDCGLRISDNSCPVVTSNLFDHHHGETSYGVKVTRDGCGHLISNHFSANVTAAIFESSLIMSEFTKNTVELGDTGVRLAKGGNCTLIENTFRGNKIADVVVDGIQDASTVQLEENAFESAEPCVGVKVTNRAVCQIQRNVFRGRGSTGVLSTQYSTPTVENNLFLAGVGRGVLVSEDGGGDFHYNLFLECDVGFSVTDGNGTVCRSCVFFDNRVTGVSIALGSAPVVSCCRFAGARGKLLLNSSGAGDVAYCIFSGGGGVGVQFEEGATTSFHHNKVRDLRVGLALCKNGAPQVASNMIAFNDVGVSVLSSAGGALMNNNLFGCRKACLQVVLPHDVIVSQNTIYSDSELNPISISPSTTDGLAQITKSNTTGNNKKTDMDQGVAPSWIPLQAVPKPHHVLVDFLSGKLYYSKPATAVAGTTAGGKKRGQSIANEAPMEVRGRIEIPRHLLPRRLSLSTKVVNDAMSMGSRTPTTPASPLSSTAAVAGQQQPSEFDDLGDDRGAGDSGMNLIAVNLLMLGEWCAPENLVAASDWEERLEQGEAYVEQSIRVNVKEGTPEASAFNEWLATEMAEAQAARDFMEAQRQHLKRNEDGTMEVDTSLDSASFMPTLYSPMHVGGSSGGLKHLGGPYLVPMGEDSMASSRRSNGLAHRVSVFNMAKRGFSRAASTASVVSPTSPRTPRAPKPVANAADAFKQSVPMMITTLPRGAPQHKAGSGAKKPQQVSFYDDDDDYSDDSDEDRGPDYDDAYDRATAQQLANAASTPRGGPTSGKAVSTLASTSRSTAGNEATYRTGPAAAASAPLQHHASRGAPGKVPAQTRGGASGAASTSSPVESAVPASVQVHRDRKHHSDSDSGAKRESNDDDHEKPKQKKKRKKKVAKTEQKVIATPITPHGGNPQAAAEAKVDPLSRDHTAASAPQGSREATSPPTSPKPTQLRVQSPHVNAVHVARLAHAEAVKESMAKAAELAMCALVEDEKPTRGPNNSAVPNGDRTHGPEGLSNWANARPGDGLLHDGGADSQHSRALGIPHGRINASPSTPGEVERHQRLPLLLGLSRGTGSHQRQGPDTARRHGESPVQHGEEEMVTPSQLYGISRRVCTPRVSTSRVCQRIPAKPPAPCGTPKIHAATTVLRQHPNFLLRSVDMSLACDSAILLETITPSSTVTPQASAHRWALRSGVSARRGPPSTVPSGFDICDPMHTSPLVGKCIPLALADVLE